jgi:hypothetical protein
MTRDFDSGALRISEVQEASAPLAVEFSALPTPYTPFKGGATGSALIAATRLHIWGLKKGTKDERD